MSVWIQALKIFNKDGMWCIPRKGSPEHAKVKKIMETINDQKRIAKPASSKKALVETPKRKLRTEKEKKESSLMAMEDKDANLGESDDKIIMKSGRKNTDYWISRSHCMHNAFYNTKFLKNNKTHTVRAGELFYKGDQKTDGEINWKLKDFKDDLSNAHFWVESKDGTIDWIANFYMKNVDKKVWTKKELEASGIKHVPYKHEKEILEKAEKLYGNVGEEERKSAGEFTKCWR